MNILIHGICGHMGRELEKLCLDGVRSSVLAMGVDAFAKEGEAYTSFDAVKDASGVDCIIDFSFHTAVKDVLDFAVKNSIPAVIATTGFTDEERAYITEAAKSIPIFHSANMSLGVALLVELAKKTAAAMPDAEIEIIEKHHNRKVDAPSGTALMIASALSEVRPECYNKCGRSGMAKRDKREIGIHAIRMGNIVGEHEVMIGTANQTITLKHEAHSRALFAEGALAAAEFIIGRGAGLYEMKDIVS